MTLQEAIEHCEEKAKGNSECAKDHAQLAEWLKELEVRRKEEVVHCKDCVYYEGILEDCCNVYYTRQDCPTNFVQEDDDYCSWGVRKAKE